MNILVIGNPISGTGQTEARIAELVVALEQRGHEVDVFLTQGPSDARDCARDVGPDVERLIIAGGDGTVNDVLNGLPDPSLVPILQLPTGTANMFARDLGLPWHPSDIADLVDKGRVQEIDMGLAGEHRFLMLASAGWDAWVTREIRRIRGKRLGYTGYLFPILRIMTQYCPIALEVLIDEEKTYEGGFVLVLNIRHYGGYFVFSEDAGLDSGHFDVRIFRSGKQIDIARYFMAALLRRESGISDVTRVIARRVSIQSREPCPIQADGDFQGTTPVHLELKPAAVRVVVPLQ